MPNHPDVMDKLVSLSKRRGFIFQSSEIYGGTGSVWDYGPLGVELKKNLKDQGGKGELAVRVDDKVCVGPSQSTNREDAPSPKRPRRRPGEGKQCQLPEPRLFNLMFKTFM